MHKFLEKNGGYVVWINFDRSAQVYELFSSEDSNDWIGCADTLTEAREIGWNWIADRRDEDRLSK